MTEALLPPLAIGAALGSGLVAGIFFAFSTFVMRALGRLAPREGIMAMQAINVAVINPWFLGVFLGTALLCLGLGGVALAGLDRPGALPALAGAGLYLLGTILVTVLGNVPLNDALARIAPDSEEGESVWARYRVVWTRWNHLRTAAAVAATACFLAVLP